MSPGGDQTDGPDDPGPRNGRRRGRLSEEDAKIWRRVTAGVRRQSDARLRPPAADARPSADPPKPASSPSPGDPSVSPPGGPPKTSAPAQPIPPQPSPPPVLRPVGPTEPRVSVRRAADPVRDLGDGAPGLDGATARRLRRGGVAPEARIDLHGMTAHQAHQALTRFILSQRGSGARCVLVITGKGGRGGDDRGVLKREAPHWLRQPPLSAVVLDVYRAHRRHGGDGALYVYLRKPR